MFICLEGVEGAGKTSLARSLESHYQGLGREVLVTREPGGSELGKKIRKLLLHEKVSSLAELLLFAADRAEHVETLLKPALSEGKIIICDRFIHSSIAYQGYGRELDKGLIEELNAISSGGLTPNKVLLLDLEVEAGLRRAESRKEGWNKFEDEELEFHKRVRKGFLELADALPALFSILNAAESEAQVLSQALEALSE